MDLNVEQQKAFDLVKKGKNVFITGSAGTGKSFIVKYITNYFKSIDNTYALTALTGCAATLINAQTIHSYLCLGINNESAIKIYNNPKNKLQLKKIKEIFTIIIDEISMMNDELLTTINQLLMLIKNNDKPFGGIQIIFVGDFCQLPPIQGMYCFQGDTWNELNLNTIILNQLMRQKDDDLFRTILEEIRYGKCSKETFKILKELKNTTFNSDIKPTKLYPINKNVDIINTNEFNKLCILNNNETKTYKAIASHLYIKTNEYDVKLTLNTQVLVTRNIAVVDGLVNGTRGIVVKMELNHVVIKDINDKLHVIEYYKDINENNKSWVSFLPIKLAYALSIHKAQGATLDAIELDLGSDIFVCGQLYTALSRAKSLKSIKIININKDSFLTNNEVKKFYNTNIDNND